MVPLAFVMCFANSSSWLRRSNAEQPKLEGSGFIHIDQRRQLKQPLHPERAHCLVVLFVGEVVADCKPPPGLT